MGADCVCSCTSTGFAGQAENIQRLPSCATVLPLALTLRRVAILSSHHVLPPVNTGIRLVNQIPPLLGVQTVVVTHRIAFTCAHTFRFAMHRSVAPRFFSQHRTPVLHQSPVDVPLVCAGKAIRVAYLLCRNQIVKHSPHPLEVELSYTLEREHQRYSRHEGSESATHFLASRGQAMDSLNRSETSQIEGNFFGVELYQDAMKVVLQRFHPEKRLMALDFYDPTDAALALKPPVRTSVQRALDDHLFLLVKSKGSSRWTLPSTPRRERESLRMTVDRCIAGDGQGLDAFVWSNAPQAVIHGPPPKGASDDTIEELTFIFAATYLSGRPKFDPETVSDHAWVRRCEIPQYAEEGFDSASMCEVLLDIAVDATFDGVACGR